MSTRACVVCSKPFVSEDDEWWCSDVCWAKIENLKAEEKVDPLVFAAFAPESGESEAELARKSLAQERTAPGIEELLSASISCTKAARSMSKHRKDAEEMVLLARDYLDRVLRILEPSEKSGDL